MADQKVPNPQYLELQRLRTRIVQMAPELAGALDGPAKDMGSGKVWSGPVADTFSQEVGGRKKRAAQLTEALMNAIDAELRSTPQTCTLDEAQSYLRTRRMAI